MLFMIAVGRRVVRSDILLPASQFRRLSRTIRMPSRTILCAILHQSVPLAYGLNKPSTALEMIDHLAPSGMPRNQAKEHTPP